MDKHEAKMVRPIPAGFRRVYSGDILPDDLCLSVMTGEWIRYDDPDWLSPSKRAEEAFMVVRASVPEEPEMPAWEIYDAPPEDVPPTFLEDIPELQGSLFA